MSRERFVQAHRTFRLPITIPASNGTHVTLAALAIAAQAALTPAETMLSAGMSAKTFDMASVVGFEIDGNLPASATQRPAIYFGDGLSAAATIDTARAKYVAAGFSYAPPAINDVYGSYMCSATTSPIAAVVTFAVVVRGA